MNKPWYKSKTIWLAVFQAAFGISLVLTNQFPEVGALAVVKSVCDILLRLITQLPIEG